MVEKDQKRRNNKCFLRITRTNRGPYFLLSWEQRKVGELLVERNEMSPKSEEYPLMAFIANEGVAPKGDRYDRSSLVNDTENKLYKRTEYGDFIYSSNNLETGSIGLNKYGKATISPVYSIFQPTGIADSDFIGRRLVRKDFINAMVKWRQGVIYGQWKIHESDFVKIEIAVPNLEEQKKIGTLLDSIDNLITLHQRKDFVEIWRKFAEERYGKMANDWEQRKFEELFFEKREKTEQEFEDKLLSCAINGIFLNSELFSHFRGTSTIGYLKIKKYDLVLSAQNLHLGNANVNLRFESGIISPAYKVFEINKECEPEFIQAWVKKEDTKQFFLSATTEGASQCRKNIEWNELNKQLVCVPKRGEQVAVGKLIMAIDNLITLHQCKCLSVIIGKAVAGRSGQFPENANDWEQRKLGKCLEVSEEKNNENIYGIEDVLSVSGDYGVVNQIEFQGRSFAGASVSNYGVVHMGNVVYTKSPLKSNPYGIIKTNKGKTGIVSVLYGIYSVSDDICPDLIQTYFEQDARLNNYLRPLVNKGAKNTLLVSDEDALQGDVVLPLSYDEQLKIKEIFDSIDNLITLHRCKDFELKGKKTVSLTSHKNLKKTTSWEQRELWTMTTWDKKFNEVERIKQPNVIKYPYVLAEVFSRIEDNNGTVRLLSTGTYIGYTTEEKAGENLCEGEIVAIPWGGVPNIKYFKGKFVTADNRIAISNDKNVLANRHIALWMQSHISVLESLYRGASIKHPSMSDVLNMVISFPSIEEQEQIADFIFELDNLITLHQRGLIYFKEIKNDKRNKKDGAILRLF